MFGRLRGYLLQLRFKGFYSIRHVNTLVPVGLQGFSHSGLRDAQDFQLRLEFTRPLSSPDALTRFDQFLLQFLFL